MSESNNLDKKIKETKKSTEELKARLRNLTDLRPTNIHKNGKENASVPSRVQNQKSYYVTNVKYGKTDLEKTNCVQNSICSPKKVRNYDVQETREYIKKQREKRSQQLKSNEAKLKDDIKKEKLQKLHEKAQELVLKNVHINRQRSKSREKEQYIRIDSCDQLRNKSVSKDRNTIINLESKKTLQDKIKNKIPVANIRGFKEKRSNSDLREMPSADHLESKIDSQLFPDEEERCLKKNGVCAVNSDNKFEKSSHNGSHLSRKDQDKKINILSNITIRTDNSSNIPLNNPTSELDGFPVEKLESLAENIPVENKQVNNTKKEYPSWLQEAPAMGHPLNFINTVKRKLQYAVLPHNQMIDRGIQSSLAENNELKCMNIPYFLGERNSIVYSEKNDNDLSKNKSFHSHLHQNLDIRSVKHMELIPKSQQERKDGNEYQNDLKHRSTSKTFAKTEEESESDTSKNIPDISSESGSSLRKNAESVRRNLNAEFNLSIDTDKINQMKLVPQIKSKTTTIRSENQNTFTNIPLDVGSKNKHSKSNTILNHSSENIYDYDFESDNIYSNPCLSKSRDSILSFNSPEYNEQQVIIPFTEKNKHLSTKKERHSHSLAYSNNEVPVYLSDKDQSPMITELSIPTIKSQSSLQSSNKIIASSPKNQSQLKTEYSSQKIQKNVPEVFITEYADPIKITLYSVSSINGNFLSNSQKATNDPQSSQREVSNISSNIHNINTRRGSGKFYGKISTELLPLEEPKVYLSNNDNDVNIGDNQGKSKLMNNMCVRSRNLNGNEIEKTNEIHLKFEAEIHLLNDFNQSLKQFSAVEKVVESLKSRKELSPPNILQNKDTQTSGASKTSVSTTRIGENDTKRAKSKKELPTSNENKDTQTPRASQSSSTKSTRVGEKENKHAKSRCDVSSINFSRGSHVDNTSLDTNIFDNSIFLQNQTRINSLSALTDIPQVNSNKSLFVTDIQSMPICEVPLLNNYAGFSLIMFDQLIKDEEARLENLKMILKIREKALLDRVRAELASLEIQRKHYKETGNLQEVSAIKKKQRGILLNHQREKYEMQRVKQIQQAASVERKTILKEQRKLIRKQLSTDNMLGKMKMNTPRKRTTSGPLKVIQSHTESIMSETSLSRKSSTEREVYSVTSHHTVSRVSEISEVEITIPKNVPDDKESLKRQQNIKRTLLMREAALRKRRKEAEELLQWNQKLLEEEKRIHELELKANSIIRQRHNTTTIPEEKYLFNGKQLNKLWYNLTGCAENKFPDQKIYRMSQIALERFCKSAREYSVKTKKSVSKSSNSDYSAVDISVSENVPKTKTAQSSIVPTDSEQNKDQLKSLSNVSVKDYSSDFEGDTSDNEVDVEDIDVNENINELDELIHNFSRIEDDISSLSSKHSRVSLPREEIKSESPKSNKSESEAEISVIATNGIPKDISSLNQCKELIEYEPFIHTEVNKSNKKDIFVKIDDSNIFAKSGDNLSLSTETHDNLNKSKEILLILGESQTDIPQKSTESDQKLFDEQASVENINTSEEILSTLNQIVDLVSADKIADDSALINVNTVPENEVPGKTVPTESKENLNISAKILNSVPAQLENADILWGESCTLINSFADLSLKEPPACELTSADKNERIEQPDAMQLSNNFTEDDSKHKHNENDPIIEESFRETDIEEDLSIDLASVKKSDETIETAHRTKISDAEHDVHPSIYTQSRDTNSRSRPLKTEHSEQLVETGDFENDVTTNKSFAISDDLEALESSSGESSAVLRDLQSGTQEDESISRCKETVAQQISIISPCKIENETERIQEESEISKNSNSAIQTDSNEVQNECYSPDRSDSEKINEIPSISNTSQSSVINESKSLQGTSVPKDVNDSNVFNETSPKNETKDVKKRLSKIKAETNQVSKSGDRSPRLQDFYTTTSDLMSPLVSPDSESPPDEQLKIATLSSIFDNEAEEILKKQLAIEQEIKQITELQQKQQMPYMYMREIPNKPPPPYTPPSSLSSTTTSVAVIPTVAEIDEITKYSAKILHKAYLSNNLENIFISDKTLSLIAKDVPKEKYKFVFDLCKDLSKEHYKQFIIEKSPSWMQVCKKPQLIVKKPFEASELEKYMSKKLRQVFNYEKPYRRENSIIKWSKKKRDHVDEILVEECQAEEDQWINYEKDELIVMNQITNDIMNSLLKETADVFSEILSKRQQ